MSWAARALHWFGEGVDVACISTSPALKRLGNPPSPDRTGDRCLQLSALNEECLVCLGHQPRPIASLPFVHTARRCYRWQLDRAIRKLVVHPGSPAELGQCPCARGSKSRNKVVVGEPAAGSLPKACQCAENLSKVPWNSGSGEPTAEL